MSHFLTKYKIQNTSLLAPRASVAVRLNRRDKQLVLHDAPGNLLVLKTDAKLSWLPEDWSVVSPDGDTIRAEGRFAVTVESLDPFHAVTDIF